MTARTPAMRPLAADETAVLFFDIDGTLIWVEPEDYKTVGRNPSPFPSTFEAFRRLRERGHLAFICTGRPLCLVPEPVRRLEIAGIVSGAGASLTIGDKRLFEELLEPELVRACAERFQRLGVDVMFEGNDGVVELQPAGAPRWANLGAELARTPEEVYAIKPDLRFSKFCLQPGEAEKLAPEIAFFDERFTIYRMGGGEMEISVRGVDKGTGIARTLEELTRQRRAAAQASGAPFVEPRYRTYGFGDSENDLPMLAAVDVSVAMGNALPHVKERADYVTDHAKENGIPHALERLGLI